MTFKPIATVLGAAALFVASQGAPVSALICANDPSRTMFVGGPGTDACSDISDEATCVKSFHRSGAGPLAPCVWDGNCFGNTGNFRDTAPQSCEDLPDPEACIDPSRTIKLAGAGTTDGIRHACQTITDEATCEMAWHTTIKGVGIACCWDGNACVGSANGFWDGTCTHGNTCFAGVATTSGAPAISLWAFGAVGVTLLGFGTRQLRKKSTV